MLGTNFDLIIEFGGGKIFYFYCGPGVRDRNLGVWGLDRWDPLDKIRDC
jgi:hypothetical protein